jgi:hypothetical protein
VGQSNLVPVECILCNREVYYFTSDYLGVVCAKCQQEARREVRNLRKKRLDCCKRECKTGTR